MGRPRTSNSQNTDVPQETGLFKRCRHRWKKCECEWNVQHATHKRSLTKFWKECFNKHRRATSWAEAQEMARHFQTAVDKGHWPMQRRVKDGDLTVAKALAHYHAKEKVKQAWGTTAGYQREAFAAAFGSVKLADLSEMKSEIRTWMEAQQRELKFGGKTWNDRKSAISAFLKSCMRDYDVLKSNPMEQIEWQAKARKRICRVEALNAMIDDFTTPVWMRRCLMVAGETGMRKGEMRAAKVRHYHREVRNGITYHKVVFPAAAMMTKGQRKSERPQDEILYLSTDRLVKAVKKMLLLGPDAHLFGFDDGTEIPEIEFDAEWHRLFAKHGLQPDKWEEYDADGKPIGRRWHDLRHEACFRIASDPLVNLREKMEAMRVKDLATFNIYYKPDETQIAKAFASVNNFVT